MVDMKRVVDVAVIDEVQMLAQIEVGLDTSAAWAACRGDPCAGNSVHRARAPTVRSVRRLLEVYHQRLTPLVVAKKSLNSCCAMSRWGCRGGFGGGRYTSSGTLKHSLRTAVRSFMGLAPQRARSRPMFNGSSLARQAEAMQQEWAVKRSKEPRVMPRGERRGRGAGGAGG